MTHAIGTMSGGAGSAMANWRWAQANGAENLTLVFTDVKGNCPNPYVGEDLDTYRFLVEASAWIYGRRLKLGGPNAEQTRRAADEVAAAYDTYPEMRFVHNRERAINDHATWLSYREAAASEVPELKWLIEGRSIHDVFLSPAVGWLGNSRLSHCSWELKTKPARRWMNEHHDPRNSVVLVGMDWTETNRHPSVIHNYAHPLDAVCARPAKCSDDNPCTTDEPCRTHQPCTDEDPCGTRLEHPWRVEMPMNDRPKYAKPQVLKVLREQGVKPGRMYALDFAHSNCMGCVKAGQAHWSKVAEVDPEVYAYMLAREEEFQASRPNRANSTHLTRSYTEGGKTVSVPLPLRELRERIDADRTDQLDLVFDHGGCSCGTGERPGAA